MKTAGFTVELSDGQIAVPPEIAAQVTPGERVQVTLSWGVPEIDAGWRAAGRQRFEAAYADDDSVYESLIHDPSSR